MSALSPQLCPPTGLVSFLPFAGSSATPCEARVRGLELHLLIRYAHEKRGSRVFQSEWSDERISSLMSGMRASAQTPPELSAIRVARSAARSAIKKKGPRSSSP